ncbi:hypothetical protein SLA2020_168260 [Shorea laevis]
MGSTPAALDNNLNPNAKPWSPSAASHPPPSPPDCSLTLQMFHHRHPQPCQSIFSHPRPYANFHFIYLPALEPSLFPPHTAYNMQYPPPPPLLIETYNMGHQAELRSESVQEVVVTEENCGSPQTTRSRNRGFGRTRRSASRTDGFVRAEHGNSGADPRRSYRNSSSNENWIRVQNRASRRQPKDTIPLESEGEKTSVMIRNIPNEYTRKMLKHFLIKHCKMENNGKGGDSGVEKIHSAFDFLYLPMDFRTQMNKGYAFVNFTNPEAAWRFFLAENKQSWDFSYSNKIRDLCCATIQGKEKLVRRFEGISFPREEYKPLCFEPAHDGSGQVVNEIPIGFLKSLSPDHEGKERVYVGSRMDGPWHQVPGKDQAVSSTLQIDGHDDFPNPSLV